MTLAGILATCLLGLYCSGTLTEPGSPTPTIPPTFPPPIVPPPVASEVFVGAGDIAVCGSSGTEATARLLEGIGGTVFAAGDNAYPEGAAQNYRDCYDPTWGRQKFRTRPAPGNHEYLSPGAAPYFAYFGAQAGPAGVGYYSFELGAWHAISLNSNVAVGQGSVQGQWLRADLGSSQTKCTIAYWHHPLFTSGANGENPEMREFWRMLYAAGVDIIVNGHDHMYERFAPQDPDGSLDPVRGIRQFTVGTGGAPLTNVVKIEPNSEVRVKAFGVLKLTLSADTYQWEFIAASQAGDSGTGSCH
jgi:acid phosphatase type 7